jgi:hypothetical protein
MAQAILSTGVPAYSLLDYTAASASYGSVAPTATKPTTGVIYDSPNTAPSLLRVLPFSSVNNATGVGVRVVGWTVGYIPKRYTNLLTYSQAFDDAAWTKSEITCTGGSVNAEIAPDGTLTADVLLETTNNADHKAYRDQGSTSWTTGAHTFSVYLKGGKGRTHATVCCGNGPGGPYYAVTINLSTGAVTQVDRQDSGNPATLGTTSNAVTDAGNGWWRVAITTNAVQFYLLAPSNTATPVTGSSWGFGVYAGNASNGMVAWGAQLEWGSTASPYAATTAAAVTAVDSTVAATPTWFSTILGDFTLIYSTGTVPSTVVNNNATYIFSNMTQVAISPDASLYQPAVVTATDLGTASVLIDTIGHQIVQLQFKANSGNMGAFWCSI